MAEDIKTFTPDEERAAFATMDNGELAAYWNILQAGKRCIQVDPDNKTARHEQMVKDELTKRGIPHENDKRIVKLPQEAETL